MKYKIIMAMIGIIGALLIVVTIACTTTNTLFYNGKYWDKSHINRMLIEDCKPLLNKARTWTDTMLVYTFRPGDTYHGDPSCYTMEKMNERRL